MCFRDSIICGGGGAEGQAVSALSDRLADAGAVWVSRQAARDPLLTPVVLLPRKPMLWLDPRASIWTSWLPWAGAEEWE